MLEKIYLSLRNRIAYLMQYVIIGGFYIMQMIKTVEFVWCYNPQQAEAVFDKVSDPNIKNYPGLIIMLQGFQKHNA